MLKKKLNLKNLTLRKEDILNLDLNEKFDYVICTGVLHHTSDPYMGFKNALRLLKPGGYIIIGLYNKLGRKVLEMQRFLLHVLFSDNKTVRDAFLKPKIRYLGDKIRANAWYNDQFVHPHESTHTVAEVLEWFRKNNVEFINSAPPLGFFKDFSLEKYKMFEKQKIKPRNSYIGTQFKWIFTTGHDGGLWMTIGKKKK